MLRKVFPSLGLNRLIASVAAIVLASAGIAHAQVVLVPPAPQVGSSNPATAEPPVPRPHTTPCIVPLFQEQAFADFNLKSFSYTPPSSMRAI